MNPKWQSSYICAIPVLKCPRIVISITANDAKWLARLQGPYPTHLPQSENVSHEMSEFFKDGVS